LRPGLAALLGYARAGDAIVVVGIDRLGRNAAEVMATIRELGERGIVLRSLREGIDTSNATGRMVAGVLAILAELELELGRERRTAACEAHRAHGQAIGRPKALDTSPVSPASRAEPSPRTASAFSLSGSGLQRSVRRPSAVVPLTFPPGQRSQPSDQQVLDAANVLNRDKRPSGLVRIEQVRRSRTAQRGQRPIPMNRCAEVHKL
jgi:hypothetical protein